MMALVCLWPPTDLPNLHRRELRPKLAKLAVFLDTRPKSTCSPT